MHTQTIGEALVARAHATRRRFAGIDAPATAAIAETVAGQSPARRMAEHMREIEAASGSVVEADLLLKGWTAAEIAEEGREATRLARLHSVRRS